MSTVLVVQPDETQADVLLSIFAKRVGAELIMVDSAAEALGEICAHIPDLITNTDPPEHTVGDCSRRAARGPGRGRLGGRGGG